MKKQKVIEVLKDFSDAPGARLRSDGPNSAEEFRDTLLAPALKEAALSGEKVVVDLDGVAGYAGSFIEEAFGGLVRCCGIHESFLKKNLEVLSAEEPYLLEEIWEDINSAQRYQDERNEEKFS